MPVLVRIQLVLALLYLLCLRRDAIVSGRAGKKYAKKGDQDRVA